jgi:DNA methylase
MQNNGALKWHPVHEMMSRTGSFPLEVASRFIRRYCKSPSTILDPFCGKGTTLLAARLLGHRAYGLDIAPEAVVCSSAKLASVTLPAFTKYLTSIRLGLPSLDAVPDTVLTFFEPTTLKQILSLRTRLLKDLRSESKSIRSHANFGLGCLLGILHGHASYSLSIPSAHAFSMAPSYVARFATTHRLRAPMRDVKACLLLKAAVLLQERLPNAVRGEVRHGCARELTSHFPRLKGKVDMILTSPPYLSAQTYAKDNWLRLWLLGYDQRELKGSYIETGSVSTYRGLMTDVLRDCCAMLRPGGFLVCVAGDVRRKMTRDKTTVRTVFRTGSYLSRLASDVSPDLTVLVSGRHQVKSTSRYFHSLSKSNGHGNRSLTERYFVAVKAHS